MLLEPKARLADVFPDPPKRLLPVGIDLVNLNVSWLVEVVTFVPNPLVGVEEDVPNTEKPAKLCEGSLSDVIAGPKTSESEPLEVEDGGCTAAVEVPVTVVSEFWVFEGENFVPKAPPGGKENKH